MQAVIYSRYGGPEVLELAEVGEPEPGAGQVRVRVQAAGVNAYDAKRRSGRFARGTQPASPLVPGLEAAGIVDRVGIGVVGTGIGDEVLGLATGGAAAELAVLTAWAPQPAGFSAVQSGGLAVVAETAVRALDLLGVGPGDRLLVHGGSGGVGQAAVQLARLRGAMVAATASPANHPLLARYGALPTTYGDGMADRVRDLLGEPTLVLDVAGSQLDELLTLVPDPDRVVTIANYAAGERGVRVTSEVGDAAAALAQVAALAAAGRFALQVSETFGFDRAAAAHRLVETRRAAGKIVLVP